MNKQIFKACMVIVLIWTVLCAIGALANYVDHLQQGTPTAYVHMLALWWGAHALVMAISCAGYAIFTWRPGYLARARSLALGYAIVLLAGLPLQLVYLGWHDLFKVGAQVDLARLVAKLQAGSGFGIFLEFAWLTFTYVALVGVCGWRERSAREKAWAQSQHDNLQLRFDLEQQRLRALRGQLEPHFLFNALNAISALVRTDDKRVALGAIGNLSELLRYALQASEQERVTLADERKFVSDYLALQKLRYGERLQVHVEGDEQAELPPLLLQPLIENALRHDLDCHDGASDIRLAFGGDARRLTIHVSNPCGGARPANPGLGLGLRHTRARLQMAYGDGASMAAGVSEGRFQVDISLPRAA
jgi:two-component system sensor histidine kinase AlgZ